MKAIRQTIGVLMLLAAAGCAANHSKAAGPAPVDNEDTSGGIPVVVNNQNLNDMNVYFVRNGSRALIGHAPPMTTSTITIPAALSPADLRVSLVAVPIGGSRPFVVPETLVPNGQRIYWTIGTDPSMSTVSTGE
jgi:hypothetical protein